MHAHVNHVSYQYCNGDEGKNGAMKGRLGKG